MREIIFRGKCINNIWGDKDGWIYGSFVDTQKVYSQEQHCFIVDDDYDDHEEFEVFPQTIGQYTGLTDKNGKKIFEADILKIAKCVDQFGSYFIPPAEYPVNVVVKWDLCAWMWETISDDKYYISFPNAWCHYECEVIGNIYDNPEILDSDKKGGTE